MLAADADCAMAINVLHQALRFTVVTHSTCGVCAEYTSSSKVTMC
jgi:hypothetical protein